MLYCSLINKSVLSHNSDTLAEIMQLASQSVEDTQQTVESSDESVDRDPIRNLDQHFLALDESNTSLDSVAPRLTIEDTNRINNALSSMMVISIFYFYYALNYTYIL